jgi:ketosteroid isomerase-like protein
MSTENIPSYLTKAEVEFAVRNFWELFVAKKTEQWKGYYAEVALVFGSSSKRPEPSRLAVLRRQREYLASSAKMTIEIGRVEVDLLSRDCGVAAYLMRLDATNIAKQSASGQHVSEEHLEGARVTQIFQRQEDGKLRIVHEHISVAL